MEQSEEPRWRAFKADVGKTPKTHDSSETVDFLMCPEMAYRDFSFLIKQVLLLVVRPTW